MRRNIVAGNWKMNKNLEEGLSLVSEITNIVKTEVNNDNVDVIIAPSFVHLSNVAKLLNPKISLAAQNCSQHEAGAYTGEVSAEMLHSLGAKWVIIGHSERRKHFAEDNRILTEKVNMALSKDLNVIFCCGESLDIRESGKYNEFIQSQLEASLFHLSKEQMSKVVIAYEPIWAIGTGKTASAAQAQEAHASIRQLLTDKYDSDVANDTSILYGGSCKPSNAKELFACPDVDGGLIGGAALKSRDFVEIIKSF